MYVIKMFVKRQKMESIKMENFISSCALFSSIQYIKIVGTGQVIVSQTITKKDYQAY